MGGLIAQAEHTRTMSAISNRIKLLQLSYNSIRKNTFGQKHGDCFTFKSACALTLNAMEQFKLERCCMCS